VVRAAVAAFNANDMDTLASFCTEDVESVVFEDWPDDPVYYGHEGMKRLASLWWEYFSETHMAIDRLIEDGERVVVLSTHSGSIEGNKLDQPLGVIISLRDGLMAHLQYFIGFERTLAEAGIESEPE
jgi:ketosteroid isomerase-like protein